jgi:hypothetical protein
MGSRASGERVTGTTLRWTFSDGAQAGKTYEHAFRQDGTVAYRAVEAGSGARSPNEDASERPSYAAYRVSDDVDLVSYRAESGFTLTVALNFSDHRLVSVASNSEQWFPATGTFEDLGSVRT